MKSFWKNMAGMILPGMILSCIIFLGSAGLAVADVDVELIKSFEVDSSRTYLSYGWHANMHLNVYGGGVRSDSDGNLHMAYGDDKHLRYAFFDSSTGEWRDILVDMRSKGQQRPSLARNKQGIYLLAEDSDTTSMYHDISDSSLYFLPASEDASWTKLSDIYADRATRDVGSAYIAELLFADSEGDMHILMGYWGWWSYGYAQHEVVFCIWILVFLLLILLIQIHVC